MTDLISETELAIRLGVTQQRLQYYRKTKTLLNGRHWFKIGRGVFYTTLGEKVAQRCVLPQNSQPVARS